MTIAAQVHNWRSYHQSAILVALIFLVGNINVVEAVVTDEGWALLDFRNAISDPNGVLRAWQPEDPFPCEWYGISCDKNFHISGINLHRSNLSGVISPELQRLPRLRTLSLSENNFSGVIPPQLSEIGSLWKLKLDHNRLSGSIPGALGHLSNLKILDLSYNDLSGRIPESIFRTCRRLRFVSFAQNRLGGSLPDSLCRCERLTGFDFSANSLQGNISVDLSNLKDLSYIDLQRNSLSGHIPSVLGNLTALTYLNMGDNVFSGRLPLELNLLRGLKQLSLNSNLLSGEVPEEIVSLPSLQHLDLSWNTFSGRIRLDGVGCRSLRGLNLAHNMFEGDIPQTLSNCTQLVSLNLANNRLNGSLPPDIGLLAGLISLDASSNQLVGEFPGNISGMTALSTLVLRNNGIHGNIPSEIGNLKALEILDLSNMRLDGGIPSALTICTALQKLDLSVNKLNGSIPADLDKLSNLRELDLENNTLTGGIPAAIGNLSLLAIFNVSYNNLSGRIPISNSLAQFGYKSFLGNPNLCGAPWTMPCIEVESPVWPPPRSPAPPPIRTPLTILSDAKSKRRPLLTSTAITAIAITATIAVSVLVISILSVLIRRRKNEKSNLVNDEEKLMDGLSSPTPGAGKLILFDGVHSPTHEESAWDGVGTLIDGSRIIGSGSIGAVFKATGRDGVTIAVKKLRTLKRLRDPEEFEADMLSMKNLRHQHLVELRGYYLSSTSKLILWEFVANGTLYFHLHERKPKASTLTWLQRFNIGLGIARGLEHLHSMHRPPIMHFNLTSANVLLDDQFQPKISDYGLRKFLPIQNKYISSRLYHETLAYVAPELACGSLRVSEKCDVYSFGVVLLELVTGQKPCEVVHGAAVLVGEHVKTKLEQGRVWECIDSRLADYNGHEVGSVIKLALRCTSQEPSSRPTMVECVRMLESSEGAAPA